MHCPVPSIFIGMTCALPHILRVPHYPFAGSPLLRGFLLYLVFPSFPGCTWDFALSALHLSAAMASADFCSFRVAFRSRLFLLEHSVQTSPGTTRLFPSICLPHLPPLVPCSYWTLTCQAALSQATACIQFLFVKPEVCRRLPSDSTSRWTSLPLAVSFPLPGRFRTFTG